MIDVHSHALAAATFSPPPRANPVTGAPSPPTDEELMERSIAAMKSHHVVKAVTSGTIPMVRRWFAAAPDIIIPSVGIRGRPTSEPTIAELRAEHAAGRLLVIGEVGAQYEGLSPSDPALEPLLAMAADLDLPVGIHMGTDGGQTARRGWSPKYRMALGSPFLLEDALLKHPTLRVYVMHAAWPLGDEMVAVMKAHRTLYVDLGAFIWMEPRAEVYRYLQRLIDAGFGKRIMFGSDFLIWPESIGASIAVVRDAPFLDEAMKRDILCRNAATFLRLDQGLCQ